MITHISRSSQPIVHDAVFNIKFFAEEWELHFSNSNYQPISSTPTGLYEDERRIWRKISRTMEI